MYIFAWKLSGIDEAVTTSLWASSIRTRPLSLPVSGTGLNLKRSSFNQKLFNYVLLEFGKLPMWHWWILKTFILVLFGHSSNLLLVAVRPEHLFCLLLIECTAHPTVCWVHGKDTWAIQPLSLPNTPFDHAWKFWFNFMLKKSQSHYDTKFILIWGNTHDIKTRNLGIPKQFKQGFITFFQIHLLVCFP